MRRPCTSLDRRRKFFLLHDVLEIIRYLQLCFESCRKQFLLALHIFLKLVVILQELCEAIFWLDNACNGTATTACASVPNLMSNDRREGAKAVTKSPVSLQIQRQPLYLSYILHSHKILQKPVTSWRPRITLSHSQPMSSSAFFGLFSPTRDQQLLDHFCLAFIGQRK